MPRIFIGLKASAALAEALAERAAVLADPEVRRVAVADIHLTLVPPWNETDLSAVTGTLARVSGGFSAFTLELVRLTYAPDPRQPRLLWAECLASATLTALHDALLQAFHPRQTQPFRPHLTLARLGRHSRRIAAAHPLEQVLSLRQPVTAVTLFQSPVAGGGGYSVLAQAPLGQ
ncbi:MAG TPA: RNA 2',3'-cyclic phosphodiesterase [Pseudomonadales bacterium]|jgi:2'-5' RNA ligase|uniref:RNA 2',3'-cyclic phosphodiesterase n=1 Tax=Accumulibacter sp. TaxID=2053492 RepID=UPI002C75E9FF|nr:RNA 2',3'-cyclic phosphodiesterase [Accumulibacter sp.]HMW14758.1 RNA 2',3'-cyclic phosphodiesterase [Pseudomonadales bacterium]HMZ70658.1 RNA 2',3'-cyclic phosphodiesterase [Pseudomonadales bacterium]HNF08462.1 RNA 2',3'-cyclic phosphodiesterase [Pseudomonadales bacterium]HNG16528.1 RNA 2',3'-cyclic phosphodiesterase [Accumulibacter sp.]HNL31633.1 RNA 2',3'-cyclic phosphodiesterase [Pseudomonadales bacterium]